MDADALGALELPAITARLASVSSTELGTERARALTPATEADAVHARQALTAEAVALLGAGIDPPLAGIVDLRPALARAGREGTLGSAELRAVATGVRVELCELCLVGVERLRAPPR